MKRATFPRQLFILATASAMALGLVGAGSAQAATQHQHGCPAGELFATNNTAIITDPADPRLRTHLTRFNAEVRAVIRANGAWPGRSQLLDGVFWSADLKQTTYERSREFDLADVSPAGLRHIAGTIAKQYHQEAVLTFRCLPSGAPETDAAEIQAPGVTSARLRNALLADPEARDALGGGSVTLNGRLILIAPLTDLPLAKKFTQALGVDWDRSEVRYGAEEFVS